MSDFRMPTLPKLNVGNHVKWMYERLAKSINEFESKLDPDHEIGLRLVSFSATEVFHIDDLGYWGPDLIIFYGKNADGHPVELYQHMSQISVLLVAAPKREDKAKRIGFILMDKVKEGE